jgi:putative phosphoesterase
MDAERATPLVVGVISDTHGHLCSEVEKRLQGVDHIIHAGDVGTFEVLRALRRIAPVTAVRGNVDMGGWADALPSRAQVELGGVCIVVGHISPRPDGAGNAGQPVVVVAGHSHVAAKEERAGVLYLNPGSAGPRRFGRPRSMALLEIRPAREDAEPGEPGGIPRATAEIIMVEGE